MKLSTISIGIAVFMFFGLILVLIKHRQIKGKKKKLMAFAESAREKNYLITKSDSIDDNLIGIDSNSKVLIFKNMSKKLDYTIDLKEYKKSYINEISTSANSLGSSHKLTSRIELLLQPKDLKKPIFAVEFYDVSNGDFQLSNELQFLKEWTQIINNHLN
jgi:hypothetical protein